MADPQAGARFQVTQSYPAGIAQLWTVLGTRDYVERKYRGLGSKALRILRFEADETRIEIELERSAPVGREAARLFALEVRRVLDEDFAFTADHLQAARGLARRPASA